MPDRMKKNHNRFWRGNFSKQFLQLVSDETKKGNVEEGEKPIEARLEKSRLTAVRIDLRPLLLQSTFLCRMLTWMDKQTKFNNWFTPPLNSNLQAPCTAAAFSQAMQGIQNRNLCTSVCSLIYLHTKEFCISK